MAASPPTKPASTAARPYCDRRSGAIFSPRSIPTRARWRPWPAMCWRGTTSWPHSRPPRWSGAPSISRRRRLTESVDRPGALPYCPALRAARTSIMTKDTVPQAEFSRLVAADQVGPQETEREIVANPAERARLAERFGLLALDRLTAAVSLKRGRGGLIQVRGRLEAEVVQACVVTLEPVRSRLSESFAGAVVIGLEDEDPPEELIEGRIDLGETVAQQLAVALDPYPHAPGAEEKPEVPEQGESAAEKKTASPFAALARLRERRN